MRIAAAALALGLAAGVAVALAGDEKAKPHPHPHFNDAGTLSWSEKLADAQKAAKDSGKLIFIEYGREA